MQFTSCRPFRRPFALVVLALLSSGPALGASDGPKSAAAAKDLSKVLAEAKLDSIATVDPAGPGGFIAALYIPDTQFLVVSAKYSAPTLLVDKINAGDFRGVYMDLHAAGTAGTKIFVQDIGPDGLVARNDNADSWEEGGKTMMFDGRWKKGKSSEAEYAKACADADERYATMLSLLVTQLKGLKAKPGS